jgi:magnesium-transporting ATPase (P-type)
VEAKYNLLLVLILPPFAAALRRYDNGVLTSFLFLAAACVMVLLQNNELFKYILTSSEARGLEARGIQIRDSTCLDVVSHLDTVCLDKTGVLTTRDIKVRGIHLAGEIPDVVSFLPDDERGALTGIACALCNDIFFLERRDRADPIDRQYGRTGSPVYHCCSCTPQRAAIDEWRWPVPCRIIHDM